MSEILPCVLIALVHGAMFLVNKGKIVDRDQIAVGPLIKDARSKLQRSRVVALNVFQRNLSLGKEEQWNCHIAGMHIPGLFHHAGKVAHGAVERNQSVDPIIADGRKQIRYPSPTETGYRNFRDIRIRESAGIDRKSVV